MRHPSERQSSLSPPNHTPYLLLSPRTHTETPTTPMSSENTAVYVHESRFPLRILKRLVQAGPAGEGTQVKRLDALFRYEANAQNRMPKAPTYSTPSSNKQTSYIHGPPLNADREKGKAKQTAAGAIDVYTGGNHDDNNLHRSIQDNENIYTSEILTFESPIEGVVTQWCVPEGELLLDPYQPILRILEPCKHPVQLGGLCAVCGKDLTSVDYTGFRETSRASISMAHDTANLTVSLEEAARLEKQTTTRLREERKLSLIVDLDQTIIQATVDPTVGEWMFDEKNPNYPVLRDVQRFKLLNEDGKEEGCWYYVKPRPTLKHFLEETSRIYELHVYTMGTRQYAENVCRIIDPDGRMFANRILSRDESGSLVRKSLERLFPVDQSMVVIIDDRADIWDWSPHLVKVVPYDFFVGIGDINSAFLPKQRSALAEMPKEAVQPMQDPKPKPDMSVTNGTSLVVADESIAISEQNATLGHQILDKPLARMQEEKSAALHEALDHAKSETSAAITPPTMTPGRAKEEALSAEVPTSAPTSLVEKPSFDSALKSPSVATESDIVSDSSDSDTESDAEHEGADHHNKDTTSAVQEPVSEDVSIAPSSLATSPATSDASQALVIPPEEEAVLHDDDNELERVLDLLGEIHRRYYTSAGTVEGGVPSIIPRMKSEVLQGCSIVFSGVIPLDKGPETSEVWQLAEQFGATCSQELTRRTTHVIAARRGTSKVNSAQRRRDVSIVTVSWLLASVNLWRRQPESAYALDDGSPQHGETASTTSNDVNASQNEPKRLDAVDLDEDEELHEIDWGDAEAEIQAFLDETDEEDSRQEGFHDDDADRRTTDEETSTTIANTSKRSSSSSVTSSSGSPLAKRRKVAAARAGQSKLRLSENALTGAEDDSEDEAGGDGEDEDLEDFAKALEGELM